MKKTFVHLHNHSDYSLGGGLLHISKWHKPTRFLLGLAEKKIPAIGMTDRGNMCGALDFYNACKVANLKPIVGCEFYVVEGDHKEKDNSRIGHLTLLARNYDGFLNLMKLNTASWTDGFYHYPRIDKELLAAHSKGLLCLSGCAQGFLSQYVREPDGFEKACALAHEYESIFGKGNYYIELMDHGIHEEKQALPLLKEVAKKTGIAVVATNDCRFENKEDWDAYAVQMCMKTGKKFNDPAIKKLSKELYFKSSEEMWALFAHTPEACQNTLEIAEKCTLEFPKPQFVFPQVDIPAQFAKPDDYLKDLCKKGLGKKLNKTTLPLEYKKRLGAELKLIKAKGVSEYFLFVSDFVNWARVNAIPVGPGWGSSAGSLVAYSLDITRIDPVKHGLLFERFFNADTNGLPDIDIDLTHEGRDRVLAYIPQKQGADCVSHMATFGSISGKTILREVARVMNLPAKQRKDLIKKAWDAYMLPALFFPVPSRADSTMSPQDKRVLKLADKLKDTKCTGVYSAGVLITKNAVSAYVPLMRTGADGQLTTQFDPATCAQLGLLKQDLLGLEVLGVIARAEKMIRARHNPKFDIHNIVLDDPKTYEMLGAGQNFALFQFFGEEINNLVKQLKPNKFSDLAALLALYRPGPLGIGLAETFVGRKNGQEKFSYQTPLLENILKETYGCIIYQEQLMQIAQQLGGFSPTESDTLRKIIGKHNVKAVAEFEKKFVAGCKKNHIPKEMALSIYEQMRKYGGYGFNKSHAYSYALIAYQVAYLKANYPLEFLSASLANELQHTDAADSAETILPYLTEVLKISH